MSQIRDKAEEYLAKKQEAKEFKDIGKRASGAAKVKAAYRVVSSANLDEAEQDETLADELVKKDRVYPVLNIEEEKEKGSSPSAVFMKVKMRSMVQVKPPRYALARKIYVAFIERLVAAIEPPKTLDEFKAVMNTFIHELPEWFYRLVIGNEVYDYYEKRIKQQEIEEQIAISSEAELLERLREATDTGMANKIRESISANNTDQSIIRQRIQSYYGERTEALNDAFPETSRLHNYFRKNLIAHNYIKDIAGEKIFTFLNDDYNRIEFYKEAKKYAAISTEQSKELIEKLEGKKYPYTKYGTGKTVKEFKETLYELDNIDSSDKLHEVLLKGQWGWNKNYYFKDLGIPVRKWVRYDDIYKLKNKNPELYFKAAEIYKNIQRNNWQKIFDGVLIKYNEDAANFQPREDDWSFAETKKRGVTESHTDLTINVGKPLEFIKRIGGLDTSDIVDSEKAKYYLTEILGFKAMTLGETVSNELARSHIRHFVGAMADFADILNIDIKALNQLNKYNKHNQGLSFAIGAFITKFAAIYRTGDVLINLTKKNGQGTLAHEYAHYIDNTLSWIDNPLYQPPHDHKISGAFGSESMYGKELRDNFGRLTGEKQKICFVKNAAVCEKMLRVMNCIYFGNADGKENSVHPTNKVISLGNDKAFSYGGAIKSVIQQPAIEEAFVELFRIYPSMRQVENITKNNKRILQWVIRHYGYTEYAIPMLTKHSIYYQNSSAMGSRYWIEPCELFARANETYIFDKLDKAGRANNYLVSGDYFSNESGVYPALEEREALFILYDELYATIKKEYAIGDFKPWTDKRTDDYVILKPAAAEETVEEELVVDLSEEQHREALEEKIKHFNSLLMLIADEKMKKGGILKK